MKELLYIMEEQKKKVGVGFGVNELPNPIYFPSAKVLENYKAKKLYVSQ